MMLLFFLILLISTQIVRSPFDMHSGILKTDCYKSLSSADPVRYMELFHFYPTGPLYLAVTYKYKRSSSKYEFKKINDSCKSSIFFTTGSYFKKFDVNIDISFFKRNDPIATMEYSFYNDYYPGIYKLIDINEHFAISVEVAKIERESYIVRGSPKDSETYLRSIERKRSDLCVVTENNPAVVLKREDLSNLPSGFITDIVALYVENEKVLKKLVFGAFECYIYQGYPNIPAIFAFDNKNTEIRFAAINWNFILDKPEVDISTFKLSNHKFIHVSEMKFIPVDYRKILLMEVTYGIKKEDSQDKSYMSENIVICCPKIIKRVSNDRFVEHTVSVQTSPCRLCNA